MRSFFPSISELLGESVLAPFIASLSRVLVGQVVRENVQLYKEEHPYPEEENKSDLRSHFKEELLSRILLSLQRLSQEKLQVVINATGVVLHTNLGRAPISPRVWDKVRALNTGYTNLEIDLQTGKRGKRGGFLRHLLLASLKLDDTFDVVALNNNAAAVFLYLATLPKGSEVIVSRGELVQIGGGFRIPDIMKQAGVRLVEVGTTNRTHLADYQNAINESTAAIFKVHRSNFYQEGFVKEVSLEELSQICSPSLPLVWDQGSGNLWVNRFGEPSLLKSFRSGVHLGLCSGDKLLGGPQAGLAIGKKNLIASMRSHPLYRAFRPSRLVYSLLQEHLLAELSPQPSELFLESPEQFARWKSRAQALADLFPSFVTLVYSRRTMGGGSSPKYSQDSVGLRIAGGKAQSIQRFLRHYTTPILADIQNGGVLLDISTLKPEDDAVIQGALLSLQEHLSKDSSCLL